MNIQTRVHSSNKQLLESNLVMGSFGNASARCGDVFYIKPSGVDLMTMEVGDAVCVSTQDGKHSGDLLPSSDAPTHLQLYREFSEIHGIVHTHSVFATAWAQAVKPILCLGTTHADYWNGEIPITRELTDEELNGEYEKETGKVIIEKINELKVNPLDCPGILAAHHGPFTWGSSIEEAVKHAELLEYIAKLAWLASSIDPNVGSINNSLRSRHFYRKHGPKAYYGQKEK